MSKRMKGFSCCGDCIHYNYKKYKCNWGASVETDVRNPFYDDCPIPDVPSEQEIRNKAITEFANKIHHICKECPVVIDTKSKELIYVPAGDNMWHGLIDDLVWQIKQGEQENEQ